MRICRIVIFCFFIFTVTACSRSNKDSSESPTAIPPTSAIPLIPTANLDTGVVKGQLLTPDAGGKPYITELYLGKTIYANGVAGSAPVISFSERDSPKGIQDQGTGIFYFADVPPGEYALINWNPAFSMAIKNSETQADLIFTVKANETTDLGVLLIP
jgi:hypothetical protein